MRDYATVSPKFWMGETGRALRADPDAQRVAFYLLTCPSSTMLGMYYLTMPTMCHEIGMPLEGASKALRSLKTLDFASYDQATEWVWVHEMARFQIGDSLEPGDKRVKGVIKAVNECRKCPFVKEFVKKYATSFHIPIESEEPRLQADSEAPSKGLGSPYQASRAVEQWSSRPVDQSNSGGDSSVASETPTKPASPTVLRFQCSGAVKEWELSQEQVDEWQKLYPSLNVLEACRKACARNDATTRKTARGMKLFLVNWLNREVDFLKGKPNGQQGNFGSRNGRSSLAGGDGQRHNPDSAVNESIVNVF